MKIQRSLLERARAYDQDALVEVYGQYGPLVYGYIYRRVGDSIAAERLVGEVFVRALRAGPSQNGRAASFRSKLYRIAHHVIVAHHRTRRDNDQMSTSRAHGSNGGAAGERLISAVKGLTDLQQEVLVLRFGEGLTARQTAAVMEKNVSVVERLQRQGLESLRRIVLGEGWET